MPVRPFRSHVLRTPPLIVAILSIALAGESRAQSRDAAETTLQSDLQSLVREGVRIGVILGRTDNLHTSLRPRDQQAPLGREGRLAAVASQWSETLMVTDGAVARIASPSARLCVASLAQKIDGDAVAGNAIEVMFAIAKAVDPRLAELPPPGLMGSAGQPQEASLKLLYERTWLTGGRMTVDAALDQFVTRLDGFGWWVAERCNEQGKCSCQMGLLTADNVLFSGYDISPPATRGGR